MDKKEYLIIMRIADAVLFVLAVLFMVIDAFYMRFAYRVLYAAFFCAAALLLIVSSIIDLVRMENFVKKIEGTDTVSPGEDGDAGESESKQ